MPDCECIGGCPFFNDKMANMPRSANLFKQNYCKDDFASCARYTVFKRLGKPAVPPDLFPNMKDRAAQIIRNAK